METLFKPINFTVNGKATNSDELLVHIPIEYREEFEGVAFETMHDLSMALMFAGCAAEAKYYGLSFRAERDEQSMRLCLKKGVSA